MAILENPLEPIERRLDLMIQLLCLIVDPKKLPTISDQVGLLSERGLTPTEIGKIVGREANYVSATLKNRKKVKKNVN
jgi:hypothetical protein